MRETIFISHATLGEEEKGLDNDFSLWLYLRLVGMGYKVWCDIKKLKGGEDFWTEIEYEIRDNTVKYLYVLSGNSNHREGTLKELAVALKTKKELKDPHFIIPLHIDKSLSYDDTNIELVRLNSIKFTDGWSKGLGSLLERFSEDRVPQPEATNYAEVSNIWQTILLAKKRSIKREETYASNWFPIVELPENLYFHKFSDFVSLTDFPIWNCKFPASKYKQYLATFAQHHDFMDVIPNVERYDTGETAVLRVSQILRQQCDGNFIDRVKAKNIMLHLLGLAINKFFVSKGLREYRMANKRKAYWFEQGVLNKDKANKVLMVGKMKYGRDGRINWHFGVSGSARIETENYFVIGSHIIFTWNGKRLIDEDSIQHRCRRKQGKDWWNRHWRDKLLSFMRHFSDGNKIVVIKVGSEEAVKMSDTPFEFRSPYGYLDPDEKNLPTEDDDINAIEETEEEIETEPDEEMTE